MSHAEFYEHAYTFVHHASQAGLQGAARPLPGLQGCPLHPSWDDSCFTHQHAGGLSLLQHIRSRRWDERWVGLTAHRGRSDELTRTRL